LRGETFTMMGRWSKKERAASTGPAPLVFE
jgi:hypothetical protein